MYAPWARFYLAVVIDTWSRRVAGWAMATHPSGDRAPGEFDTARGSAAALTIADREELVRPGRENRR